uniref:cDNA FLJ52229 n=1 Tax=Homo sapiens TaxID=9606 RepID=B4DS00_HUMAN|nr:unnamed protein product [Homo sapiens]
MSYAEKPDEITKDEWMEKLNNLHVQRADMNRLIMNYLVTEGFKEAAEKFRMESGIEPSVDLETLDERIKIREMILKGQIQQVVHDCWRKERVFILSDLPSSISAASHPPSSAGSADVLLLFTHRTVPCSVVGRREVVQGCVHCLRVGTVDGHMAL